MMRKLPPKYIANFDSTAAMVRSTARFLRGKDFPTIGMAPVVKAILPLANRLPRRIRELDFAAGGWTESISPDRLGSVRAEEVARWITDLYPRDRRYPAVLVGSNSGAIVHLAAALGIPWLPQTFLVPVAQLGVHPDDPKEAIEAAIEPARRLLNANPDLQLHHMHDPNQHRLLLHLMTTFRVKWLRLPMAYRTFLKETLEPGGTVIVVEGRQTWPTTRIDDRHVFQMGTPGGATPEEYLYGSDRVREFLQRHGSHRERWEPPEPDGESPEAEWGFEPQLLSHIESFAGDSEYRVARLTFDDPEDPSPFVADLYRSWYRERNLFANRLLVESSILHDPWWTLQTGSAPFWLRAPMESSAARLERYLGESEPYEHMHMMLFSHGVEFVGLAPIARWRTLLQRARRGGWFVGVDEDAFPRDLASFARYHEELKRIPSRYGVPGPMGLTRVREFLEASADLYAVTWVTEEAPVPVGMAG